MEKQKINILIILSLALFMGCNVFGLINYSLTPIALMNSFLISFIQDGRLFTFDISNLVVIPFIILSWYNFKKISISMLISFILNLIILNLVGWEINKDIMCYALNFSLILVLYIIIRQPMSINNLHNSKSFEYFVFAFLISFIFSFIIQSGINFGSVMIPISKDIQAILIDDFINIPRNKNNYLYWFNDVFTSEGYVYKILSIIYKSLSILVLIIACLEFKLRSNKRFYINSLLFAYIGSIFGVILYFLYPIMGPLYFEQLMLKSFPDKSNWIYYIGNDLGGSIFPRNAMPSLHVAFALFLYINSRGLNVYIRSLLALFLIGTALSTLVLGEHYIIDWIISPAFVLVIMSICAIEIKIKDKFSIILENLLFIFIWYVFLFYGLKTYGGITQCLNCQEFSYLMTTTLYSLIIISAYLFYRNYKKFILLTDKYISETNSSSNTTISYSILEDIKLILKNNNSGVSLLFIFSGFAGLMYQVVFGKMMGTIFGSTSIAIYIVLATYMIGLSLGAYLGGRDNSKISPLLKYAFCEILIALYCALTPLIFLAIEKLYYYLIFFSPENTIYLTTLKIILGIVALIIPTTFMGMTTPILLKHFNKKSDNSISIAHLYTLNTFGASIGAILSGYIIIQQIGIINSIYFTVVINLLIGIQAIRTFKIENGNEEKIIKYFKDFLCVIKKSLLISNFDKKEIYLLKPNILILTLLLLSGVVNMSLETLFIHALAVVVGNSTYAFSIMLFTFLIGLSIGGYLGKLLIINNIVGYKIISYLEMIIGISIFIGFNLLDLVPSYLASFQLSSDITRFTQREFIRACICFSIMILPTISIGMLYSLLMDKLVSDNNEGKEEKLIGYGLAFNTIGNIMGVFIGGLFLINLLGLIYGFKLIVIIVLVLSLVVVLKKVSYKEYLYRIVIIIIAILIPFSLNMNKITSGANVYFQDLSRGKVVEFTESIDGGLTSVNKEIINGKEILTLLTNGKFQGNNSGEIFAQGAFAVAPLMHSSNRNRALVIGYGTGMTTRVIHEAGFKKIDIVDLSSDIIFMADKYFLDINKDVRKENNVKTIVNDGRNYLKMTDKKYDFISMELTSIWFSGAAYLYNREFYKIAKEKLNKEGVLQQWVQLHHMRTQDFMVIINTVRSEFKYVNLYIIGGQGIIVATNEYESSSPKQKNIDAMNISKDLEEVKSFYGNDFSNLLKDRVLTDKQTDKIINYFYKGNQSKFYSTDDNLYLEYNTPKGNSLKVDTEKEIHMILDKYK